MNIEIREYAVGAYLKHVLKCDVVDYKVKDQSGGLKSLPEIDVIGFKFNTQKDKKPMAYLCEVKTHITGLAKMAGEKDRVKQLNDQFKNMETYASKNLTLFDVKFLFWAPKVTHKELTNAISNHYLAEGQFINKKYSTAIAELIEFASKNGRITDNPFIRTLQVVTHLKDLPNNLTNSKRKKIV